jgi:hypothetical protein
MFVVCMSVIVCIGNAPPSATPLSPPDKINTVRVYKKMAEVTVLIAPAYASAQHTTQGIGKGTGSGVLIEEMLISNRLQSQPLIRPPLLPF